MGPVMSHSVDQSRPPGPSGVQRRVNFAQMRFSGVIRRVLRTAAVKVLLQSHDVSGTEKP